MTYLNALEEQLGEQRLHQFITGHGTVQANSMFLVAAVVSAPHEHYSDEALDQLVNDARDLRTAAQRWAASCVALADAWREQRDGKEVKRAGA